MAKVTHKSQHWIPRSYLRAWTDPDAPVDHEPFVHVFSRDGKTHRRKAPINLFSETDLYTIKLPEGGRDLRFEHGLADLESRFALLRDDFLLARRKIPSRRHIIFMAFVAAMHARTPSFRDHQIKFWQDVQAQGDQMERWMKTASPEEKRRAASASIPSSRDRPAISMDDVRQITERPMQYALGFVATELPLLAEMRATILCTESDPGFITADAPVVWFNPEAYKKPPLFRSPSFSDPRLEITFPISPKQLLLLSHRENAEASPSIQYIDVTENIVADVNRRLRFYCDKEFVVRRAAVDPRWFERGAPPPDSWEAVHDIRE